MKNEDTGKITSTYFLKKRVSLHYPKFTNHNNYIDNIELYLILNLSCNRCYNTDMKYVKVTTGTSHHSISRNVRIYSNFS